jgi:hypothetical protein
MTIPEFISKQPPERQQLLNKLHEIIMENDKSVKATIQSMMGKEMIIYNAPGTFKYGLSSAKNYMSLHALPIYSSSTLHAKYKSILKEANFQKGCINFTGEEEMPPEIVKDLITDCSKIDLLAIRESYLKNKAGKR